ncbi:MAG: hypothetical protein OXN26_20000 [Gammaproteobacteria bacterium]|nr:hypothetical protein [Gammaproteobacteria bacterium]
MNKSNTSNSLLKFITVLAYVLTIDKSFLTERMGMLSARNISVMNAGLKLVMGL